MDAYMRMHVEISRYVGENQQGGQTDPKFMVILQSDAKRIRQQAGLPTVESNADARYGFDGGRHAQVLKQLHVLGTAPNNWLLVDSLLSRYTMVLQVHMNQRGVMYLTPSRPNGGGLVQGLSISSPLYTLLPRVYQELVAQKVPGAAVLIHPQMLHTSKETAVHGRDTLYALTADCIRGTATRIERILRGNEGIPWTARPYQQVKRELMECSDDSQKRLVIDWMAFAEGARRKERSVTNMGPYLFIYDSRFTTPSHNSAITVTRSSSTDANVQVSSSTQETPRAHSWLTHLKLKAQTSSIARNTTGR